MPTHADNLKSGKLQVLQATSLAQLVSRSAFRERTRSRPTSATCTRTARRFQTRWVTIHDTAVDGNTPFDANALAKAKGGTPFKRPENGQFRPDHGERVERRLAAVLAADVAGYSRLMGADEEGTLARLKAVRKALVDPTIAAHRGRIVKTTGDGMLVEFASAVDAVRCAIEVQRGMASRTPTSARYPDRIPDRHPCRRHHH